MASTNYGSSGPTAADSKAVTFVLGGAGGSAAVDYFQMRGWGTVSTTHVYWTVTGSPDFAGASAPEVVTDVVLFRKWTA